MSRTDLPPQFNRLAWSNLAAQSAEQIALAAAPLVAVLVFGAGPGETGLLQTAQNLPFLLFAIPAGVLADRLSRRDLMVGAEAVRAFCLAGTVGLLWLGLLDLPSLAALGMVGAAATIAFGVAAPSLVPALVPSGALAAANGRIELARTVAFIGGPALGGALAGMSGATPAFILAAMLSVAAIILLSGIDEPPRQAPPKRHVFHDIREGAAFAMRHDLLRPIIVTQIVFNTAFFVLQGVYAPYAVNALAMSAAEVGATLGAYGAGMFVGALLARRILGRLSFGVVIAIGPVAACVAAAIMAATIWIPSGVLAGLSFFLFGVGPILWVISTTTLRQIVTPPALLGRVTSLSLLAAGGRPLGAAVAALVGGLYGAEACLILAALGFAWQAAIVLTSALSRLKRQPDAP